MTTQQLIEKGVTVELLTGMMNGLEKLIAWYNKKYNYDIEKGTAKEQREYESAQRQWDTMNFYRNNLKAAQL